MKIQAPFGAFGIYFNTVLSDDSASALPKYTVGAPKEIAAMVKADLNVTTSSGSFSANDNATALTAEEWASAVLALEMSEMSLEDASFVFGQAYDSASKTITRTISDVAPAGGMCYHKKLQDEDKRIFFRAMYIPKLQAVVPTDSSNTKGTSLTFSSKTINFNVSAAKNGAWNEEAEFATQAEAIAWSIGKLTGEASG